MWAGSTDCLIDMAGSGRFPVTAPVPTPDSDWWTSAIRSGKSAGATLLLERCAETISAARANKSAPIAVVLGTLTAAAIFAFALDLVKVPVFARLKIV
jgi:hypothetical protein